VMRACVLFHSCSGVVLHFLKSVVRLGELLSQIVVLLAASTWQEFSWHGQRFHSREPLARNGRRSSLAYEGCQVQDSVLLVDIIHLALILPISINATATLHQVRQRCILRDRATLDCTMGHPLVPADLLLLHRRVPALSWRHVVADILAGNYPRQFRLRCLFILLALHLHVLA
jgi:hypothetical protein